MDAGSEFIDRLLIAIPELTELRAHHIADYDELLPHVFLGEVTRFVTDAVNGISQSEVVIRLFALLETEWQSGNALVGELIVVSFVENLVC